MRYANAYVEEIELTEPAAAVRQPVALSRRARLEQGTRRTLDILISVVGLVVIAPLWAMIAAAIVIESGRPVLFRQTRVGLGGGTFTMHKFRTMRPEANPERHRRYVSTLIEGGAKGSAPGEGGLYKLAVDDRMTSVGRLLRRWSLDELPQLLNVVRGQMSLVGPRPVIPYEVEIYPDWYMERFSVKPGMTGLWQVTGRNRRSYEEMISDDIKYARGESLRLYLLILIKTPWVVVSRKGAA
jgi:lipopolysaccharide/colanic/teichoic acid biosynthesis glycosyltransferase